MNVYTRDGVSFLLSDEMDLKIDTNREVYIRKHQDGQYEKLNTKIPTNLSRDKKELFLISTRNKILDSMPPSTTPSAKTDSEQNGQEDAEEIDITIN